MGLELALGARQLRCHARCRAESRIRAQVQPPIDTRRLLFMLKPTGFFGRIPALDVPRAGWPLPRRSVMSACSGG